MNPEEIELMFRTYYDQEPKIGSVVILRHSFTDTSITGELVGIKRIRPQRGGHPDLDFQFIVYAGLLLKVAGHKGWFNNDNWEIIDTLDGIEYKKLPLRKED